MASASKKWILAAAAAGAMIGSAGIAAAATGSGTATPAPAASNPAPTYNTDPAHEAGESAARQAEEKTVDAGTGSSGTSGASGTVTPSN